MKISILFFMSMVCFWIVAFSQSKNGIKNNYLTLVSATKENQITGANSPNSNSLIYDITWNANKNFSLKKIKGYINNTDVKGKLIYNNTISDSGMVRKGTNFVIRFDINTITPQAENLPDQKKSTMKNCPVNKKISLPESNVVSLSFLIENKQANFRVKCIEKKIRTDKQLPQ